MGPRKCISLGSGGSRVGQFGTTAPPNLCGTPLVGAPLPQMRPFLVPVEAETYFKMP